jgi:hypothetical protein
MRIVTTTVSLDGYQKVRDGTSNHRLIDDLNKKKLGIYEDALCQAQSQKAELLCLPAGYFYYAPENSIASPLKSSEQRLNELTAMIFELAEKHNLAIAVGLDLTKKDQTADNTKDVRAGTVPWYALCWSPSESDVRYCWNQRSVTSEDQQYCPDERCKETRFIRIGQNHVEILMCGEAFNVRIRDAIIRRPEKPIAAVDLVHTLAGFKVTFSLKEYAARGLHALCCGHADKHGAMKYYYCPVVGSHGWERRSSREANVTCEAQSDVGPRLEGKVWEI